MTTINSMIYVPFMELIGKVASFIPTLISLFLILVIGLVIAKFLHTALHRLFKEIQLDKLSDSVGLSGILTKGGIKHKLSYLMSSIIHVMVVIIFLVIALQSMGITAIPASFDYIVAYFSHVIIAVFILALGLILSKVVSSVIYLVAANMGMPKPKLYEKVSRLAIVLYAAKASMVELGLGMLFVGTAFHIVLGGIVFALALAFGLGGQDKAAGYLKK